MVKFPSILRVTSMRFAAKGISRGQNNQLHSSRFICHVSWSTADANTTNTFAMIRASKEWFCVRARRNRRFGINRRSIEQWGKLEEKEQRGNLSNRRTKENKRNARKQYTARLSERKNSDRVAVFHLDFERLNESGAMQEKGVGAGCEETCQSSIPRHV